jgi:hypothetical protein
MLDEPNWNVGLACGFDECDIESMFLFPHGAITKLGDGLPI